MNYKIDGITYNVEIIKKNNKNTYIRIKDDLTILITTNRLTTKLQIKYILDKNSSAIRKMIQKQINKNNKKNDFSYLGNNYNIIYIKTKNIWIDNNNIYTEDDKMLEKWLKNEMKNIYQNQVNFWYNKFTENIPYPQIKIRKMTTRWGVCNKKNKSITLNSDLIKYKMDYLDYVIVHELSHFVHFNHSKEFWNLVSTYYPNYKIIRKQMKEV